MSEPTPAAPAKRRNARAAANTEPTADAAPEASVAPVDAHEAAEAADAAVDAPAEAAPADASGASDNAEAVAMAEKRRIQDQLDALKRREAELLRDLALADHPGLRQSLGVVERGVMALGRVDAKLGEGPSKSEARRIDTIEKQLPTLVTRRAEIDAKITELEAERATLGERSAALREERRLALVALAAALVEHGPRITEAGLDLHTLVPALAALREEILALTDPPPAG